MSRTTSAVAATKRRLAGVAFLAVLASLIGLTVAIYNKVFVDVVPVTLEAGRVGNQLAPPADVKLRGIIVGEVRAVHSDGSRATIDLALQPQKVGLIPSNVQARLLPKTLFGEKFVDLVVPDDPSPAAIRPHATITQDRSKTAIETEQVFDDLLPLLQTVQPAKLNATLTALANALEGRGDRLGATLALQDDYFRRLNTRLPAIENDLRGLADLAETYDRAAPDLVRLLRNLSVTNHTIAEKRADYAAFLASTTGFADTADAVLRQNESRLITLARVSKPTLQLLAEYSPEYPCLLGGLADFEPLLEQAFGGRQPALHITLEVVKDQGKYVPNRDEPRYAARNGPSCQGLPGHPRPYQPPTIADGYQGSGRGTSARALSSALVGGAGTDPSMGWAGSAGERQVVGTALAPVMGTSPDEVPDVASLLFGPVARGTEVRLS